MLRHYTALRGLCLAHLKSGGSRYRRINAPQRRALSDDKWQPEAMIGFGSRVSLIQEKLFKRDVTLNVAEKLVDDKELKYKVVIFDKDGTLICFHSMWVPWAQTLASKLSQSTGLEMTQKVYNVLGVCSKTFRTGPGLLAEGTKHQIKMALTAMLNAEGLKPEEAQHHVDMNFEDCNTHGDYLKELHDLKKLFKVLKQHGIHIAVCTSDTRTGTLSALDNLGILHLVEKVVAGDDPTGIPKPAAHNALMICDYFGVHPKDAIMVGDTRADMEFGKNANLGLVVGVLSGIGRREEFDSSGANMVISSVEDVLPILLPDRSIQLTSAASQLTSRDWKLVVFDKDGTLADIHAKWARWARLVGERLSAAANPRVTSHFFEVIGFDEKNNCLKGGLLAEGSVFHLKETLGHLLVLECYTASEAEDIMTKVWVETCSLEGTILTDVEETLSTLKRRGVKLAINTSDDRKGTTDFLNDCGLSRYIDLVVTAEQTKHAPKPLPYGLLQICAQLEVPPRDTVVVGDSRVDMLCGRSARCGATVGVLSGISSAEHLLPYADCLIPNVGYLTKLILPGQSTGSFANSSVVNKRQTGRVSFQPTRSMSTSSRAYSQKDTYDYVIVGAGSAGCVLANRLSANPGNSVLLLEAGPKDASWTIKMPAALMYNLCHDKYNWYYNTVPQEHLDNRVIYWPRGRVLGGSSSLNAMVYMRGHPLDYDRWEAEGATGWSYADCLPYFRRAQNHELGGNDYRGDSGPLHVSRGRTNHVLHQAWLSAGQQAGYPYTEDMNGYQQEGVGPMDMTIHNGERWSTAAAYLHPVTNQRKNLRVEVRSLVTKILLDGRRAVGIEYVRQDGETCKVLAEREVILSGGAINSPQLLLLSGIGPSNHLRQVGIETLHHLPGVGENLQDHLEVYVQQKCTKPITLYKAQWSFPHVMIRIGLEWFLRRTGWGATAHMETGGFIRTEASVPHPDVQFHFLPSTVHDDGRTLGSCHAYQVHVGPMRPRSTGHLRLHTANPRDAPFIDPRYLADARDRWEMRQSIRLSREIFAQLAFSDFRGSELAPGSQCRTDAELDEFARRTAASAYHPSCTCRMGQASNSMAVTGPDCRVHGLDGLRVVDASVMPSVVSGNLNAGVVMIAEKVADMILGAQPLDRSSVPVWRPQRPNRQRDGEPLTIVE